MVDSLSNPTLLTSFCPDLAQGRVILEEGKSLLPGKSSINSFFFHLFYSLTSESLPFSPPVPSHWTPLRHSICYSSMFVQNEQNSHVYQQSMAFQIDVGLSSSLYIKSRTGNTLWGIGSQKPF